MLRLLRISEIARLCGSALDRLRSPVRRAQLRPLQSGVASTSAAHAEQKFGKRVERAVKRGLFELLEVVWPVPPGRAIPDADTVRRILVVRANFRMGNVVLATALLSVLGARFPQARIDFLVGDAAARVLNALPIDRIHLMSRRYIRAPWQFVGVFRRVRRVRYDLAVDGGTGSFSGALYAFMSGARERLGCEGSRGRFLSIRLRLKPFANAYELAPAVAREIGVVADAWPTYRISPAEQAHAVGVLAKMGFWSNDRATPFVDIFPGGHRDKRWPRDCWLELTDRIQHSGRATVVFLGPEEMDLLPDLLAPRFGGVSIVLPGMRQTAAILAHAALLVTPDSGPMRLAAALGVPVVAVIRTDWSRCYVPPVTSSRICRGTSVDEVLEAVQNHPAWSDRSACVVRPLA